MFHHDATRQGHVCDATTNNVPQHKQWSTFNFVFLMYRGTDSALVPCQTCRMKTCIWLFGMREIVRILSTVDDCTAIIVEPRNNNDSGAHICI